MKLTGTKAIVKEGRNFSESFDINAGVQQGDFLSSLLFILSLVSVIRATGINGTIRT